MISYEDIKPYIEKKLVSEQVHPEDENVRIFNYTQMCQFSKEWDDVTKQCRGLIMNIKTGEVLARPFPKFFNYGEHIEKGWEMPSEIPIITEKLDGSLGIMYTLNGKTWIATRGSFTSDQAIWATKWWRENKGDEPYGNEITHLFEIIYPENRIVVNYDFSGLVHIASIITATGKQKVNEIMPVRMAKLIPATSLDELSKLDEPNSEGFVVYYPNADVRIKLKFPEYVRLHKIVTGLSAIGIWESLAEGQPIKLEEVPDEFFKWFNSVREDLLEQYNRIDKASKEMLASLEGLETRKEKANAIFKNSQRLSSIIFAMMDKKDYQKAIWRMVRPKGAVIFKTDIDL